MVLYFSATGNTAYIAREIARRLGDSCVNLLDRIKANDHSPLHSEKPFVICAPVYVCEMPRFLAKYLKKQTFAGSRDVYFIFTSGGYCGISGLLAKSLIEKKKMNYCGHAEFRMPRNYVASDAYPMLSEEEIRERLTNAYILLDPVSSDIRDGNKLTARHVFLFETIITLPFNPIWSRFKYRTKDFFATDKCISCGKCVRLCPLSNITLADGKPVWGNQCSHCMACIGNCPTEAIEYGNITQSKEKYNIGKYRHITDALDRANP
ncbi:MAG: EFR1 family ferrodoxin [Alistipes sp.]|nr:EFR1 family ferrodoxin [Alistipes sp.]